MRVRLSLRLTAALLFSAAAAHAQDPAPSPEEAAVEAATSWVALVDSAQYAASWEAAAPIMRQHVTKEQWAAAARQARGPLGSVTARTLQQARYTTSLPNAPAGEYVVVQFASRFAQLPQAVETVVMTKTEPERWQPAGYFVRPAQ